MICEAGEHPIVLGDDVMSSRKKKLTDASEEFSDSTRTYLGPEGGSKGLFRNFDIFPSERRHIQED